MHSPIFTDTVAVNFFSCDGGEYWLRGKNATARAVIAATMVSDDFALINPTTKQFARLFEIPAPTLAAARGLDVDERREVAHGNRPLVLPQTRLVKIIVKFGTEPTWEALCKGMAG